MSPGVRFRLVGCQPNATLPPPTSNAQVPPSLTVSAMTHLLRPHATLHRPAGPVVLVIMDGVGVGAGDEADAVALARTPTLDRLRQAGRYRTLRAHGRAVGLPSDDDMGNSEVGHNALGAGVVHAQGALPLPAAGAPSGSALLAAASPSTMR